VSLTKIQKLPAQEYLKILFSYNPETGSLKWVDYFDIEVLSAYGWKQRRIRRMNSTIAGQEAGHEFETTCGSRSRQLRLDYKSYYVHRIIWKLVYGTEPDLIDHIDGNPLNNALNNFRSVTNMENCRNAKIFSTNTSGCTGVSFNKGNGEYEAYIWDNYKKINLGHFSDKDLAIAARKEAELTYNYHENHGRACTIDTPVV
jgi:hypothetical protein